MKFHPTDYGSDWKYSTPISEKLRAQNAELSKLNAQGERIGGMAINLCNSLAAIEDTLPAGARTDLMLLCGALHVISDPEGK